MCQDNLNIKLKNLHEIFLLREHNFSKKIIDKKTYNHNIKILKETKILQCVCIFYLSMTYNNFLSSLQLRRTTADVFRMIPYLILIIIPFFEFLIPFYLKFFPNALPSTFGRDEKKVCSYESDCSINIVNRLCKYIWLDNFKQSTWSKDIMSDQLGVLAMIIDIVHATKLCHLVWL